jgi:hypothetical protein
LRAPSKKTIHHVDKSGNPKKFYQERRHREGLVVSMTTKTSHLTNDFNSIRRFLLIKSDASRPKKILFPAGPTQRLGFIVFSLQHQHICSFSWKVSDLSSAE